MIYKIKMLLYVLILIYIHILEVCESTTVLFHRHMNDVYDDFDITTIYRITNMSVFNSSNDRFTNGALTMFNEINYVIEIHSRTNAIGMPIQDSNEINIRSTNIKEIINLGSFQNNSRIRTSYTSINWDQNKINLNGYYCNNQYGTDFSYLTMNSENHFSECYNVYEYNFRTSSNLYYSNLYEPVNNLITFYWTPDEDQTCLTMTYNTVNSYSDDDYFSIMMDIYNENDVLISSTELDKYNGVKTLKITNIDLKNNREYKLSLKINIKNQILFERVVNHFKFGLMRIAQCSNYDEEDVRIVSMNTYFEPKSFNILGNSVIRRSYGSGSCLNGGYNTGVSSKCVCPPGFKGRFCETGCGVNSYGSDCKGVCSIRTDNMCRGMFICTSYGCTCPAGLTGPLCNKDCTLGTYGANCDQTCSEYCLRSICDRYTGVCLHGCSDGYIQPYCLEKYPYLINPPTLILAKYDAVEIELNFQEDNIIGGNEIMKAKYYQLFYKSLIENTFRSSEIKSISNTNNITLEVISDLEPDTKYIVGVLLIADDGNFNEKDIVYSQYLTPCIQPQITDYNIKLMSGIQSINITWKISTSNRLACNITKYVLTLMSNQSRNQISDVQEILSSTDSGHFIDNLLPGFQYNIKLTPSTINGTLPSSPIYSISTLMTRNEVQAKNISTKIENGKIEVNWILVNSHQHYTIVNEPITSIIRYKLKRILSCSIREIEQNWTSITIFNRTNYEIFNTVPNSQYSIQVLVDVKDNNPTQLENMVDVLTPASNPKTEPLLDPEHPIYITDSSIFVQWKFDPENCSKLNGFLSQFHIELKNKVDNILQIRETKNNYISFNELKSNTAYELKVFIKTHIGYDREHFLITNFKTKFDNLKPVENLVVYKKSLKNRMVGFRWSCSRGSNVDGFIVSFNENPSINVTIIPPEKCSAWPEYYCHTFYNLRPRNNYTFKIKPKSIDYPEGGKVSSISFNSIDGQPDSPMNLKTTEISYTAITLQWDIPWIFNGVLEMFIINFEEISSLDMEMCCVGITPIEIPIYEELPTYNYTITNLQPGSTYSVGVVTVSKSLWYSSPSTLSVTTIYGIEHLT